METKNCKKCGIEKNLCDFHKHRKSKDGLRDVCKECRKIETKLNYTKNKKRYNLQSTEWNKKNKEKRKIITKKHKKIPQIRFKENIRHRVYLFLKNEKVCKNKKTIEILGCGYDFLRKYLEERFSDGMSWENYGINGWHVDHIIPLSFAKTKDEIYKLCHYTNLQPLWSLDNLKKSNKVI
jgi:hypothetical protein